MLRGALASTAHCGLREVSLLAGSCSSFPLEVVDQPLKSECILPTTVQRVMVFSRLPFSLSGAWE